MGGRINVDDLDVDVLRGHAGECEYWEIQQHGCRTTTGKMPMCDCGNSRKKRNRVEQILTCQ